MKKLILFILFSISIGSLHAIDERYVDFYYGNGVWNTEEDAKASARELGRVIASEVKAEYVGKVDLAYNWTYGEFDDIIETLYQLNQENQIDIVGMIGSAKDSGVLNILHNWRYV